MSELANKIVEIAISRIGIKEDPIGSNWGVDVKGMLLRVGVTVPAPWCMAFAWTVVDDACQALGLPNPLPRTGGVMDSWNRLDAKYKIRSFPVAGDLFYMDLGKGLGHCGIVEIGNGAVRIGIPPDIHTIDGNTNADGGREGYEVERKLRHDAKPIIGYARPALTHL